MDLTNFEFYLFEDMNVNMASTLSMKTMFVN